MPTYHCDEPVWKTACLKLLYELDGDLQKKKLFLRAVDEVTDLYGTVGEGTSDLPAGRQTYGSLCAQCRNILVQ